MNGRLNWVAGKRRPIFDSEVYLMHFFFVSWAGSGVTPEVARSSHWAGWCLSL